MSEGKPLLPEGSPFELWDVRLISGDLKLTIDELDAAFEAGQIDCSTLVRRRGTVKWMTLGQAANLESPAPTPPPLPPLPPLPIDIYVDASAERTVHVSSLPPPVIIEDAAAEITAVRPRPRRKRWFASAFFIALIGAGVATATTFPAVGHRVATVIHSREPLAKATPAAAPASTQALPPPAPSASAAPSSSSAAPAKVPKKAKSRAHDTRDH